MKRPSGIALVEVILAMSIASAVVGMLAAVVSRMVTANVASQEHLRTVVTLGRLGEQFRRDVRASRLATFEEDNEQPPRLKLAGEADRAIEYQITPAGLERVVRLAGEAERREPFVLPGMKFLGWNTEDDGRTVSLIVGRLARPGSEDPTLGSRFSIVASLAKHEPPAASP
jgi:type II secretory pathway pseudopilin PulG